MANDRYYTNKMKTQVWKVTDKEIRYIRFEPPAPGLCFQNITVQVNPFDPKEEEYLKRIAEPSDSHVYTGIYLLMLRDMKSRIQVFEEKLKVNV